MLEPGTDSGSPQSQGPYNNAIILLQFLKALIKQFWWNGNAKSQLVGRTRGFWETCLWRERTKWDTSCSGTYQGSREAFIVFRIGRSRYTHRDKREEVTEEAKAQERDNGEVELTKQIGDMGDQERKPEDEEHRAKGSDQGRVCRLHLLGPCSQLSTLGVCACLVASVVSDSTIPWTVAYWALLSMRFSRQEYWSGLPCPPSGDLPTQGSNPRPLASPSLAGRFFATSTTWEAPTLLCS